MVVGLRLPENADMNEGYDPTPGPAERFGRKVGKTVGGVIGFILVAGAVLGMLMVAMALIHWAWDASLLIWPGR
jgi:hypothetical protein